MHMAAAAGIPTLGLFGPTNAIVYQPWGRCAKTLVAPNKELSALTPPMVAEAFTELAALPCVAE